MNYATLLSAAHDYISAYNDVRRTQSHSYAGRILRDVRRGEIDDQ